MKIGIIIYSITGNTRLVARKLQKSIISQGIDAELLEIKAISDDPEQIRIEITDAPSPSGFDQLVFASPVHAFMLSKVMKTYLSKIENLEQKDVTLVVTHQFSRTWMGANWALRQMKRYVELKNGKVNQMFSIRWGSKNREQDIQELLDKILVKKPNKQINGHN